MQFRKLAAAAGSLLMTGMALATPALAAISNVGDISSIPSVADGVVNFPLIIVGEEANPADVLGAVNLGTWLAGYVGETKTVAGSGTTATVDGGTTLATGSTKMYIGDQLKVARTTFTKTDLPTTLASYTHTDASGNQVKYDQTLDLTNSKSAVIFSKPSGLDDPAIIMNLTNPSSVTATVYTYEAVATFQGNGLNISHDDIQNSDITLFGNKYVIGATSSGTATAAKLVLYGSGTEVTVNEKEETTFTIDGVDHTIEVKAVTDLSGDNDKAYISIDGGSQVDINQRVMKTIGGIDIYAKTVIYTSKTGDISSATFRMGAERITLENAQRAKYGNSDTTIKGTYCTVTKGTGGRITKLQVAIGAPKTTTNFIQEGDSFLDPVFGTFSLDFDSVSIPIGTSTLRDDSTHINIGPSAAYNDIAFTTVDGDDVTLSWARDPTTTSAASTFQLNYTGGKIVVEEGGYAEMGDYIVTDAGGEGHIWELTDMDDEGACTSNEGIELTDLITGSVVSFEYEAGSCDNDSQTIDGVTFYAHNQNNVSITLTWAVGTRNDFATVPGTVADTGLAANNSGTYTTIWPGIELDGSAGWIHFVDRSTSVTLTESEAGKQFLLPTGLLTMYYKDNSTFLCGATDCYLNYTTATDSGTVSAGTQIYLVDGTATTTFAVGQQYYNITTANLTNTVAGEITLALATGSGGANITQPAVLLREPKNDNSQWETLTFLPGDDSSSSGTPADPLSSGGSSVGAVAADKFWSGTSDTDSTKTRYLDFWGTWIETDSDTDQEHHIWVPKSQVFVNAFFLEAEGTISTSGVTSGTYREAVPVTGDIALLDSELTTAQKAANDLIVVGGPAVNTVAADLLGVTYPAYGADSTIPEDSAIVQLFVDKYATGQVALLVAGWELGDTDLAARAIQTGALADQTGTKVTLTGTTLESLTIA